MTARSPAVLQILVESATLRWFAACLDPDGRLTPLFASETGDLASYRDVPFDEQISFLRHRFCGVLQRGCDRLYADGKKACQFVVLFEGLLAEPTGELTRRTAEHLAEWMINPPVAIFVVGAGLTAGERLAGEIDAERLRLVEASLGRLSAVRNDPSIWQLARRQGSWVREG